MVEYQTQQRLHVQITPRHIAPSNYSQYMLSPDFTGYPDVLAHDGDTLAPSHDLSMLILISSQRPITDMDQYTQLSIRDYPLEL